MSADIVLSAGIRQNLLSLQSTSNLQATTQERLATGKKVNNALDNAVNFFTSSALSQRARELSNLLDSMSNGVNTLKTASNGLSSMTTTIQSMQATVTQARQDASWQSMSYTIDTATIGTTLLKSLTFTGGAVGTTGVSIALNGTSTLAGTGGLNAATATATATGVLTIQAADLNGGAAFTVNVASGDELQEIVANINAAAGQTIAATSATGVAWTDSVGATLSVTADVAGVSTNVGTGGVTTAVTSTAAVGTAVQTVDTLVTMINGNTSLAGRIRASNNAGQLQISNLSTIPMVLSGVANGAVNGGAGTNSINGNLLRANLVTQFNQLRDQLDKTAADASFNGINLLVGDTLKLFFNELGTSTLSIRSTNPNGVNSTTLGVTTGTNAEFENNTLLDARLQALQSALSALSSQASDFGSNLSIVQNRQEFTNNMINTLKQGADGLTLADTNEEGANMLALQTRQQLSITALSLASQANQSVLKLFG